MKDFIYKIVSSKRKQRMVGLIVLFSLIIAIAMIPTKIVRAKMLPGKSANTFSIYDNDYSSPLSVWYFLDLIKEIFAVRKVSTVY